METVTFTIDRNSTIYSASFTADKIEDRQITLSSCILALIFALKGFKDQFPGEDIDQMIKQLLTPEDDT